MRPCLKIAEQFTGRLFFHSLLYVQYFHTHILAAELNLQDITGLHLSGCLGGLVIDQDTPCIAGLICNGSAFYQAGYL